MDKLQAMRVFIEIAEKGSLTKAADSLGKSLPSVVRILALLEETLQVRLFTRTTRKISITEEGQIYLDRCQKILAEIDETEQLLINDKLEPVGSITITAPVRFGEMYVAPAISKFLKLYPQMKINLLLLDRIVNLLDEGIDLAVRIAHNQDSSMIAKPVGEIRQVVCASQEVIDKYGIPEQPEELSGLPCVLFSGFSAGNKWTFNKNKKLVTVKVDGPVKCNLVSSSVECCRNNLGFGMFFNYQVLPWVNNGDLKIVLDKFEPASIPVSVIFHRPQYMAKRLRLLVDFLAKELKSTLDQ